MFSKLFAYEEPHYAAVNFPLVNNPFWVILILISIFILFGLKVGPDLMKKRKPYDVRPFLFIFNGINFGTYLIGSVIMWSITRVPSFGWNYYNGFSHNLIEYLSLRIGYLYLVLDLFRMVYVVLWVLKKKETRKVQIYTLDTSLNIFISYYSMRYHPVGPFAARAFALAVLGSLKMSYFILITAGKIFTPPLWYKGCLLLGNIYIELLILKYFLLESFLQIPLIINLIVMTWTTARAGYAVLSLKDVMVRNKCA